MKTVVQLQKCTLQVDLHSPIDLSIPNDPTTDVTAAQSPVTAGEVGALVKTHKLRVDAFDLPQPTAVPFKAGNFVARVAEGSSVNVSEFNVCCHGSGTHTEAVGHILADNRSISTCFDLCNSLHPAIVVTAEATLASECKETYPTLCPTDLVITRATLQASVARAAQELKIDVHDFPELCRVLVVRNNAYKHAKLTKSSDTLYVSYSSRNPPYFTAECSDYMLQLGVHHLVTDLPSVDKEQDGGKLVNHKTIFLRQSAVGGVVPTYKYPAIDEKCPYSVTEFAYIPSSTSEGLYLIDLQIAPLIMDASPSRPVLYKAAFEASSKL